MNRCGIELANGTIRLAVLCLNCSRIATNKQIRESRQIWARPYDGESDCAGCGEAQNVGAA